MRWIIMALAMLATPAAARSEKGAWTVEEVENGCVAQATFYRGTNATRLGLVRTTDDRFLLVLQNTGWSTVEGKNYDLYLLVDDDLFEGKATGGGDGALSIQLEPKVMNAIMAGSHLVPALKVDENNETMLEAMKLTGSSAAMLRVQTCLAGVRAAKRRTDRLIPDPFKP